MPYKVTGLRSWNTNTEGLEATVRFYRDVLGQPHAYISSIG